MKNKTYGVLVVGAGWVSEQHIAAYRNNPHAKIVAVCDMQLEKAQQRIEEFELGDAVAYDDLEKALEHPGVDLVSICTPQHVHCPCVLAAARAKKHMIIEKPIGTNLEEMRLMRDAVREAGVKTVVSFVLRWNPLFQTLKSLMADNAVGEPYYVETDYLSYNGSWWSGWNSARTVEQGISASLVGGCHAIDALRWFASAGQFEAAKPVEVYALSGGRRKGQTREYNPVSNSWIDDAPPMEYDGLEVMLVTFDNGVIGKVSVNAECIMPYRFPIRIFGTAGSIFDNRVWSHKNLSENYQGGLCGECNTELPKGFQTGSKYSGQTDWIELPTILPDSSNVSHHPFQAEIDHFIDCLQNDQPSHCNLDDAIASHEIVFAALQSAKTHQPVKLPLLDN